MGVTLCDFLVKHFAVVFDLAYTATLEHDLDRIAMGKATRDEVLQAFWESKFSVPFKALAGQVGQQITPPQAPLKVVGKCPKCGGNLVERQGPYGTFAGCTNYPKCKGSPEPVRLTPIRQTAVAPKGG